MEIEDTDLRAFMEIYQKEFGVPLSPQSAEAMLSKILQLYRIVYLSKVTQRLAAEKVGNIKSNASCQPRYK